MTTEQRFQRVERELNEVRALLASAATHAEAANQNFNRLSGKVDEFIFQASRLFSQQGEILSRVDARQESLTGIIQKLDRGFEAQQHQFGQFQGIMREMNQQIAQNQQSIQSILEYLRDRNGGSSPPS